jgi:hypothetical protein
LILNHIVSEGLIDRMIIIETFPRGAAPRHQPTDPIIRIDTS